MNRMVVMRSRFLDILERNRLDAMIDVRVSARYGTFANISLSPCPSALQTLSILLRKVRPATETFRLPCVAFVIDKALHNGFFVLHRRWICQVRSIALQLFSFTTTLERAIFMYVSYCCCH